MHRILLVALLACLALPAHGWGRMGHRLIADLADAELTPQTRAEVDALLAGEPEPTLAGVAAWADELRSNDPDLGRRSAPWHYVNLGEDGCRFDAARDCRGGNCVVGAIEAQLAVLRDGRALLDDRRRALKFIVHFVGDVHQPLHAGHAHDKGGNSVQVRVPSPGGERGSNLHSWWDSGMLEWLSREPQAHVDAIRGLPLAVQVPAPALPPEAARWAEDACAIAVAPGFYPTNARLPAGYADTWTPVAHAQMRRAATRLAQLLNAALPGAAAQTGR